MACNLGVSGHPGAGFIGVVEFNDLNRACELLLADLRLGVVSVSGLIGELSFSSPGR